MKTNFTITSGYFVSHPYYTILQAVLIFIAVLATSAKTSYGQDQMLTKTTLVPTSKETQIADEKKEIKYSGEKFQLVGLQKAQAFKSSNSKEFKVANDSPTEKNEESINQTDAPSANRTASVSGNWNNTATWGGDPVPTSIDDVVINTNVTVTVNIANAYCKSLTINNTASLSLNSLSHLIVGTGGISNSGSITFAAGFSNNFNTRLFTAGSFTNTGTITATANYTNIYFNGTSPQNINNTGGTITSPLTSLTIDNPSGVSFTPAGNQIIVTRVNLFYGTVINSNKLTLGNGGASEAVVQRGVAGATSAAGSFDMSPSFSIGTAGLSLLYCKGSAAYNTGYEVPSSNTADYFYVFDAADVKLNTDLVITQELKMATGTPKLRIGANSLTINGGITYTVPGDFYGGVSSNLIMNGSTKVNSIIDGLNNFTINANTLLGGNITVSNTLTLSNGFLINGSYLTMANGSTISRSLGSIYTAPTFAGTANLLYTGSSAITIGRELPTASTVLNNVTVNTTSGVTQYSYSTNTGNIITEPFPNNLPSWAGDKGNNPNQFSAVSSNNSGGTSREGRYSGGKWSNIIYTAQINQSFNTTGYSAVNISWKQYISPYDDATVYPYTLKVQCATAPGGPWTDIYSFSPSGTNDYGPETKFFYNWTTNVGGTFYIRYFVSGYTYSLLGWYFDDLVVDGITNTQVVSSATVNGTLDVTNGTYAIGQNNNTLDVKGTITGSTIIGGNNSNLTVSGTAANLTLPNVTNGLNNFSITRPNGATIRYDRTLTVTGTLSNTVGNGGLTIQSTVDGTGSLLHNTDNVNATIERYVTGDDALNIFKYHFVSVPLVTTNLSFSGIFLYSYLFDFDESKNEWNGLGTPTYTPLDETRGYMVYTPLDAGDTFEFEGEMNNGPFNPLLTYTANDKGWNLIPNPYPSALNFIAATRFNVNGAIYVWPSDVGAGANITNYYSYVTATGVSNPEFKMDGTIPVGQSFFVRANNSSPSITFDNNARVHSAQPFYKNTNIIIPDLLRLKAETSSSSDEAVIYFREDATEEFDSEFDANKLTGGADSPQLASITQDGTKLSINSLPYGFGERLIPLSFSLNKASSVTFTASGMENFTMVPPIYLEDLLLGTVIDLQLQPVYTFNYQPGQNNRFRLRFNNITADKDAPMSEGNIFYSQGKINVDIPKMEGKDAVVEVFDIAGRQLTTTRIIINGIVQVKAPVATGVYIVRVLSSKDAFTQRILIQ